MQAAIFSVLSMLLEFGKLLWNITQLRSLPSRYSCFPFAFQPLMRGASPMLLRTVLEKRLSISNQDLSEFIIIHRSLLSITCLASIVCYH